MAINFSDPACGFYHREVVDFLNEQISKHGSSTSFDRLRSCKSWSALEKELQSILTDSAVPRNTRKSCAWGALALAVGLVEKQEQEHRKQVKVMQDQLDEQRLLINALLGMVQKQRDKHQDEKGVAEFQQGLGDLKRVEGEQSFLPSNPLSVARAEYQIQEGGNDEDQGTETRPLDSVLLGGDGGYDCTETEALKASGQDVAAAAAAAAAAATVPLGEENGVSVRANRNEVYSSYPVMQMAWSQTHPLKPLSLTSSSAQHGFASFEAAGVGQIPVVLPGQGSLASRRGSHYQFRKMLPEKFKPRFRSTQYRKYTGLRAGDWYCDGCEVMNFSWRNVCFKCKKFKSTKVIEDFLQNWGFW